jgi:hypothetical protein
MTKTAIVLRLTADNNNNEQYEVNTYAPSQVSVWLDWDGIGSTAVFAASVSGDGSPELDGNVNSTYFGLSSAGVSTDILRCSRGSPAS